MAGMTLAGSGSTTEPQGETFGKLKIRVAEPVGGDRDPATLEKAGHQIIRVIDLLNLRDRYSFLRLVISPDLTLVLNARTVAFPATDLYIPLDLKLVDIASSDVVSVLAKEPWERVNELHAIESGSGRPKIWSVRNPFSERTFHIWRPADTHSVATYKLRCEYYIRIPLPQDDGDHLYAPRELNLVVETCAQARFMRVHRPNQVASWSALQREAEQLLLEWRAGEERLNAVPAVWHYGPTVREQGTQSFLEAFWRG